MILRHLAAAPVVLLALALLAVNSGQSAGPPAAAAQERPDADVQDVVFFAEGRPVLMRFHVRINGKPFKDVWEAFIDKFFKYLDVDGDGVLSAAEAARVPPVQTLFNTRFFGGGGGPPSLAELDADKDGKVSRAELADYYRRSGASPFQLKGGGTANPWDSTVRLFLADGTLAGGGGRPSADALNNRLFELLDTNKDGKLSRAELEAGVKKLAKLDADDDEMLTPQELMGKPSPRSDADGVGQVVFLAGAMADGGGTANGPFHVVASSRPDVGLARQLLRRYGSQGKGPAAKKLTAKMLGMDKKAFARLDVDGDGELDAEELGRFAARPADLEFIVRLGKRAAGEPPVALVERSGMPLAKAVRTPRGGAPLLDLGNTRLELGGPAGSDSSVVFDIRQQYIAQFKAADKDNNGYLDRNEARQSPFFNNTFALMDRDGDGKLYLKEVLAYLDAMKDLSAAATASIVSLSASDQGKGLFDLLDHDGDGRLSARELRGLPKLIEMLDRNGDGMLGKDEIPRRYRAEFNRGPANGGGGGRLFRAVAISSVYPGPRPLPQRTAGPLWFRKMDRNRDGDVSRREFLGTDEEFKKIDTDGDGLISLEEAIAYDKKLRAKGKLAKKE
jgi:Ca2+-binding EF-hand superfamily protein